MKALLIHASYVGACAVCEPLITNPDGRQIALDPLIQDVGLQQKGVLVYEEAKVQYAAILRAFHDQTGIWPDPQPSAGPATTVPQNAQEAVAAVQGILQGLPAGAGPQAAGLILSLVQGLVKPATPPRPPGSDIPAPASK